MSLGDILSCSLRHFHETLELEISAFEGEGRDIPDVGLLNPKSRLKYPVGRNYPLVHKGRALSKDL